MKKSYLWLAAILIILLIAFMTATRVHARTVQSVNLLPSATAAQPPQNTPAPTATQPPQNTPTAAPSTAAIKAPATHPVRAATPAPGPSGAHPTTQDRPTAQPTPTGPYQPFTTETLVIDSQKLGGALRIAQIYLPGAYASEPDQRYPVLYSLDGQQLPEMNFVQNLDQMVSSGQIAPLIVVAVFSSDGDQRTEELGAGPTLNMLGWGTQSDAFDQFVVTELVPKVDSSYRTLIGAAHTGVMGWSLGGLTSFYLAWQYPDVFGTVGAFSPSFWWRTPSPAGQELQARVIPNLVQSSPIRPGLRAWFEAGTAELPFSDVDHNGVIDMIQDVQDVMGLLSAKGYQTGTDMVYLQVDGGQHELSTWETVMPTFLRFANLH